MAQWKKVVVSGSAISQLNNDANYVINAQADAALTGSFTGSFVGDGSNLTGVTASSIDFANVTSKPSLVSGSVQVDIADTTGYGDFSSSLATDIATNVSDIADLQTDSGSFSTRVSDNESDISALQSDSGSFSTRVSANEAAIAALDDTYTTDVELNASSSALTTAYVAADTALSSSIASTIAGLSSTLTVKGDAGLATDGVNLRDDQLTVKGQAGEIKTTVADNEIKIGFADNPTVSGNLTVTGDLTVTGNTFEAQVTNLNVEDRFILLNSGSNSGDSGIIFGGSDGSTNVGSGLFFDNPAGVFGFAQGIGATDSSATHTSKLGNIETSAGAPSAAPTFQGDGTIHVDTATGEIYIYS